VVGVVHDRRVGRDTGRAEGGPNPRGASPCLAGVRGFHFEQEEGGPGAPPGAPDRKSTR
jgi:hypothetical protein